LVGSSQRKGLAPPRGELRQKRHNKRRPHLLGGSAGGGGGGGCGPPHVHHHVFVVLRHPIDGGYYVEPLLDQRFPQVPSIDPRHACCYCCCHGLQRLLLCWPFAHCASDHSPVCPPVAALPQGQMHCPSCQAAASARAERETRGLIHCLVSLLSTCLCPCAQACHITYNSNA